VFLSSHIIEEVDRTCDRVAIIREGRLVQVDRIEAIRRMAFQQVELRFAAPVSTAEFEALSGVTDVTAEDGRISLRVSGPIGPVVRAAARHELIDLVSREPNLEDVFLAQYETDGRTTAPAVGAAGAGRDEDGTR
jgi:ABC-2 type transport system ATP-binding protein